MAQDQLNQISLSQDIDKDQLYSKVSKIIESSREEAVQAVYNSMTKSYFLIGKEIVEEEQNGQERAEYGKEILKNLSDKLSRRYGKGFSVSQLRDMRQFYLVYSKQRTVSGELTFPLTFSHYIELKSLHEPERFFYEQLAIKQKLSSRKLKEVIKRNEYERSLKNGEYLQSTPEEQEGIQIVQTNPITKDPLLLDFLGFDRGETFLESDLEKRIIDNIERFLLEIGRGFAFVGRQYPVYIGGQYYYVDLVFYHVILKCYVLIDLKREKIEHGDLGQMMMYVNYFDRDIKQENDALTVGVVLGADKDDSVVEYTLGDNKQVFATRYLTYLPSKEELLGIINSSIEINTSED